MINLYAEIYQFSINLILYSVFLIISIIPIVTYEHADTDKKK